MNVKIAVIGLGYVGLPLARLFSTKFKTVGYDINKSRVDALMKGGDSTLEISREQLVEAIENGFVCSSNLDDIKDCNVYIITVPTPITASFSPDLQPLLKASETVGNIIKKGDVIIYESTVYPGATEEDCVPVIEAASNMKFNVDFFVGYSPERINPGDKLHTVETIKKVTSGSTPETAEFVDNLYREVIKAGTYLASSIKVAEASKIIENTQRDVNIALVNEIAIILNNLGIDTNEVLDAASSKWNFIRFGPGLVGGHCIGIDPYYLIDRSRRQDFYPPIIVAARTTNEAMPHYISDTIIKLMNTNGVLVKDADILMLGYSFKENCADIRNTKVNGIISKLSVMTSNIDVYDPIIAPLEYCSEFNYLTELKVGKKYDVVVLAVAHDQFLTLDIKSMLKDNGIIYDVKGLLPKEIVAGRL